ncbi:MAG: DUF2202 domain-containing protein [candidate division Zixibacteria bacterium]|nr:DUF2202 domain-containing protein [candidate division Zixibacteria bacterium]
MKKSITTICTALLILVLSTGIALARNGKLGNFSGNNGGGGGAGISSLPYEELSAVEIDALTYMVEEEKVARDVYNVLYETWDIPVFANIANAEQRHMDAVIALLDKYGLENPTANLDAGNFDNPDLQTLYNNLITAGQVNEEEALLVGATIEDVDIFDLIHELTVVDNEDITRVFENLLKGSENHLRAFCSLLTMYGYDPYVAQFLTQTEIDEILAATQTKGRRSSLNTGFATPQDRMLDADGDGICDFLQQ